MKRLLIVLCLILFTACGKTIYNDTEKIILNNTTIETKNSIRDMLSKLTMFPTEEDENRLVTYLQVINDHKDNYNKEELIEFKNLFKSFEYSYQLNSLGYNKDKVNNLIDNLDK